MTSARGFPEEVAFLDPDLSFFLSFSFEGI
jgi:hypothetical protein